MTVMWCGGRNSISIELKKRKIMRIQSFILPMIISLGLCFASCSNENEEWEYDYESDTWETELRNVVSDFNFLFENSFVKFLQAEELNCKVDSSDFFNDETYYPVCIKNLYNFFMPKNMTFVMNDTSTIHMPYSAIRGIISNIIDNQDKYDFVKLTWAFGNDTFTTVAVFNKDNGQIIYDNIFTNIPLSQIEIPSQKSRLTRSEPGTGVNVITKIFYRVTLPIEYEHIDCYILRVKALCDIHYYGPIGCPIYYVEYKSIHKDLESPVFQHYYPLVKYDARVYQGMIISYLWLGTVPFPFSGSPEQICEAILSSCNSINPPEGQTYIVRADYLDYMLSLEHFEANPTSGEWGFD